MSLRPAGPEWIRVACHRLHRTRDTDRLRRSRGCIVAETRHSFGECAGMSKQASLSIERPVAAGPTLYCADVAFSAKRTDVLMFRCFVVVLSCSIVTAGCDSRRAIIPTAPTPPVVATTPAPAPASFFYGPGYSLQGVSLSGVVQEITSTGTRLPIEGANVYCDACGAFGHMWTTTDGNGFYHFSGDLAAGGGIWLTGDGLTPLLLGKGGYQDPPGLPPLISRRQDPSGWREVRVNGDTRFDMLLIRR